MTGVHMRRRLVFLIALALLVASVAVPSFAAGGKGFSMKLGSTLTITGRTGSEAGKHSRATGKVVLSGRWGAGTWHVISSTTTDSAGNYRFAITPHRRGNLALSIAPPDHHLRRYLLHVS
jgi:hypothetical protein